MSTASPLPDTPAGLGRVLIGVLAAFDALAFVGWLVFALRIAPSFLDMFADFGGELPLATRVVVQPAFGIGMAVGVGLGTLLAATLPATLTRRASLLGALLVGSCAVVGASVYALYLPIFAMAGAVR